MKRILPIVFAILTFGTTLFSQISNQQIQSFLDKNKVELQLTQDDISDWIVTDQHTSKQSGITHIYLRQKLNGIEIHGAETNIHRLPDGTFWTSGTRFVSSAIKKVETSDPQLTKIAAIEAAAKKLGYTFTRSPQGLGFTKKTNHNGLYEWDELSKEPIPIKLVYQKMPDGKLRVAYDMAINETKNGHWWGLRIDAQNGRLLEKNSWTLSCSWDHNHSSSCSVKEEPFEEAIPLAPPLLLADATYNVFPAPVESPIHGSQSIVSDPADIDASPFGWHDLDGIAGAEETRAKGNNVQAHLDLNDDDDQSGFSPDGGADLEFDYDFDPTKDPSDGVYRSAAITNLFYWNNLIHDVLYHYGFDEESGNFQENNYGNGGNDGDSVNADAQDGSGTNNANFGTPPDGSNPRMQMYIWTNANPDRDSDFDNGVIIHEYGHGISNRLTGGGKNTSCLGNREQMGEGWSDYLGLIFTIEPGDAGTDQRGIGNYVKDFAPDGGGIRPHPYSTDMTINPHTYDDIQVESRPHGLGSVWCAMLWEMTWALIDEHGFNTDLYHGTGGNNMALQLVMEGMKLQPCSPGFVDGRNAILKADQAIYGGANQCLIWQAFAKRGLGYSADQGLSDDEDDGTEAFDLPADCQFTIKLTGTPSVVPGSNVDYSIEIQNVSGAALDNMVLTNPIPDSSALLVNSISDGGIENNGMVEWTIGSIADGATTTRTFSVMANATIPFGVDYLDDLNTSGDNWSGFSNNPSRSEWSREDQGGGDFEWFAGEPNNHTDQYLTLVPTFKLNANSELSFNHSFDTEITWDGGQVHISTDGGIHWEDLGTRMTQNGYNSTINNNSQAPAFAGNSNGYQTTIVDLSDFAGELAKIRFWFHADAGVGGEGWYLDDIEFSDIDFTIDNKVTGLQNGLALNVGMPVPTVLENGALPVELGKFDGKALANHNLLEWNTLSEQNVESFLLMRSRDGVKGWEDLGVVKAQGSSFTQQQYDLKDADPWTESFYKLTIVDFDGSAKQSPIIRIIREELSLSTLDIYPNPFENEIQLSFNLARKGQVQVSIKNLYGSEILYQEFNSEKGTNFENLSLGSLAKGVYLIHLIADGQQRTLRLVKQ